MEYQILTLNQRNITDFAKVRNELLIKSKSEWILFLDTDEKLSEKLKKEIEDLDSKDFNGFYIKREIFFLGKHIGEDKVLRLAKKNSGKWQRAVHETWNIKGKVGWLNGHIIHNTATNLHDYLTKMNNYTSIHAVENQKEGKTSNLLKIIIYPKIKFIQNYFSGRGFAFSMLQSFHSFLGWVKLWELQRK
jgi:hypothetical protein